MGKKKEEGILFVANYCFYWEETIEKIQKLHEIHPLTVPWIRLQIRLQINWVQEQNHDIQI